MYPHWERRPEKMGEWFEALVALARYLRGPDGCPWDRKQTSKDFAQFAVEEAGELVEACETSDNAHIAEEFGDTLFCLLALSAAAEHEGRFDVTGALERAHAKMIRRHGHVFGEHEAETAEDALRVWQEIKKEERSRKDSET